MLKYMMNAFLAAIFLTATTGVVLNKHYCMGNLKSVTINESATPCAQSGTSIPLPCCEEISQELKVEEVTQVSFEFDLHPALFDLGSILFGLFNQFVFNHRESPQIKNYFPPPPYVDFQSDYQVFLI
ncbi:MAG: hypothetical protein AAGC64_04940 [Bacteroidota bacterium]